MSISPCDFRDSKAKLKNVELLGQSKYEEDVESYIEHAVEMDTRHSYDCLAGKGFGFYLADEHGCVLQYQYSSH